MILGLLLTVCSVASLFLSIVSGSLLRTAVSVTCFYIIVQLLAHNMRMLRVELEEIAPTEAPADPGSEAGVEQQMDE